ncbi:extracellular matrix regulator RemB [Cerasibacillus sp. JNUCC 74]
MFIHIGNNNVIHSCDVIAIIDYHLISSSTIMEELITESSKQQKIVGPLEAAKSIMITKDLIYYSSLSVSTLKKRASMISTISKLNDFSDDVKELDSEEV